ncbi:MAG: RelA/SpoT domain-containing protein [Candidatus Micrarchaeia archaeon]|jgi:ppGpp synthetase/RelA/SpoT-type nucleotidyltranferase
MAWTKPAGHTKEQIDHAGDMLLEELVPPEETDNAIEVLSNWRACHSYPMHVFKVRLKSKAKEVDKNALAVQRLKRVPAIKIKLERDYGNGRRIKLSEMQDIAGCRAILSHVSQVKRLYTDYYLKGDIKHGRVKINDYISHPKKDGYRSYHIIYSYLSDKTRKKDYNGLLVELQFRSKLQHQWATAIEIVDFFTKQAIKSNVGSEPWKEFFRLLSSAFAMNENCPMVKGTPTDEKELYLKIKEKEVELDVMKQMNGWMRSFNNLNKMMKTNKQARFFLLDLDISRDVLRVGSYTQEEQAQAVKDYSDIEKRNLGKKEYDVVLVGADTFSEMKSAYPNYFVDSTGFLKKLKEIVEKY